MDSKSHTTLGTNACHAKVKGKKKKPSFVDSIFGFFSEFSRFLLSFQIRVSACFLVKYHLVHNRTGGQLVSISPVNFVDGGMDTIAFVGHFDQTVPNNFSSAIRCLTSASFVQGEVFRWL
jgi:hypothetical protein